MIINFLVNFLMAIVLVIALLIIIAGGLFVLRIAIYWWLQIDYVEMIKNTHKKKRKKHEKRTLFERKEITK